MRGLIIFAFTLVTFFQIHSEEITSKKGKLISLEPCQMKDLDECCDVFVSAFLKAYENFTPEILGVEDKALFLQDAFEEVYDDFLVGEQKLFTAKFQGELIGFVGFKKTEKLNQVYITQLAVSPDYWHEGIGKHLVFSALSAYADIDSLVVISRKINEVANNFYKKLNFSNSAYLHPGYSPEKYIGFEWSKTD